MTFSEEWDKLRSNAASQQEAHTRLNQLPSGPGAGADFLSSPARKQAAIAALESEIEPGTKTAGGWANDAMESAAEEFQGWGTALGINDATKGWQASVRNLQARLASEKDGIRGANRLFQNNDREVAGRFSEGAPDSPQGPPKPDLPSKLTRF